MLLSLMVLPAFAVANDAVVDRLEGRRSCLDHQLAAPSAELTDLLCVTPGVDGPPLPAIDLGGLLD
ncbi:hypothetical protein GGQ22_04275 [Nocardioides sp. zg-579]|uniref:Uncharacterized protein n=1 Tax=Nocardioides marmotae TaxID=2663857 RepID=A0A6I3J576_9ACTN|nr:hypothetical protein [Nocardioides marmotae]MCR6030658.1 hypothetical protein [Gordonia jinghuaiqii]MTB94294.1 hypothetical protein [Nocardioides marmotae]QKE00569.1 hypothetical protein HPC71_05350 [Nocardioides marmotae]